MALMTPADPAAQTGPASFARPVSGYGDPANAGYQPQAGQTMSASSNPYSTVGQSLAGLYSGAGSVQGLQGAPTIGNGYQTYLNQARSRISSDLAQSLGDINQSEMRGAATIGQIPGQLQGIYGGAEQQLGQEVQAEQTAQKQAGLQSFQDKNGASTAGAGPLLAGQGGVAPVAAAMKADQTSRASDVPLLMLGNSQLATQQRGRAHMTAEDLYNQNDLTGAQLSNQNAIAQAQMQGQFASSNNDFLRNAYLQGQGLQGQAVLAGAGYEGQTNLANIQGNFGVQQAQAYRGGSSYPFAGLAQQADPSVSASNPLVKAAQAQITKAPNTWADVIRQQQAAGHARTAARLAQMYAPQ